MTRKKTKVHPDWVLVQGLGGPSAVAKVLDLPAASGAQTVQNWKHRGIPAGVKIKHPELFLKDLLPQAVV